MKKEFLLKTILGLIIFGILLFFMPEFGNDRTGNGSIIFAKAKEIMEIPVYYIDSDGVRKITGDNVEVTVLNEETNLVEDINEKYIELDAGWYYIKDSFDIEYSIKLPATGEVNIILGDNTECNIGCGMSTNLSYGIFAENCSEEGSVLNIYSQSFGLNMGKLTIYSDCVGIVVNKLVINGGRIVSNGCNDNSSLYGVEANYFTINNGITAYTGCDQGVKIYKDLIINGGRAWFRLWGNSANYTVNTTHFSIYCGGKFIVNGGQVEINGLYVSESVSITLTKSPSDYVLNVTPYAGGLVTVNTGLGPEAGYSIGYGWLTPANSFKITFKYEGSTIYVVGATGKTISETEVLLYLDNANASDIEGWYNSSTNEKFEFDKTKITGEATYIAKFYSELDPEKITVIDMTYNGKNQDPYVKYEGNLLYKDVEYTVVYKKGGTILDAAPIDEGEYIAEITGKAYYSGSFSKTFKINKKKVSVSGITVTEKDYDGTCDAVLDFSNVKIEGRENNDLISVTAKGVYEDSSIGSGKNVKLSDIMLIGEKSRNYEIVKSEKSLLGNIKKRLLTIKCKNQTVEYGKKLSTESDYYEIIDGSLLEGHKITAIFPVSGSSDTITAKGYITINRVTIKNGEEDVTHLYAVRWSRGVVIAKKYAQMSLPEKRDLTYKGISQPLLESASSNDGTIMYALGKDETNAPTDGYADKVPEAKDVGDYFVWIKLVGDEEHYDIDAKCIKVVIAPLKITITADDKKSEKGTDIADLTYTTSPAVFEGDNLQIRLSTKATKNSDSGVYPITIEFISDKNYSIETKNGEYSVVEPVPIVTPLPYYDPKPEPQNISAQNQESEKDTDHNSEKNIDTNKEQIPTNNPEIISITQNVKTEGDSIITETKTEYKNGTIHTDIVVEKEDNTVVQTNCTVFKNGDITVTEISRDDKGKTVSSTVEQVKTNKKGTVTSSKTTVNSNGVKEASKKVETVSGKITEKYSVLDVDGTGIYSVKTETSSGDKTSQLFVLDASGKAVLISSGTTKKKTKIPEKITVSGKEYTVEKADQTVVETKVSSHKIKIDIIMTEIQGIPVKCDLYSEAVPSVKLLEFWKFSIDQVKEYTINITAKDKKEYKAIKKKIKKRLKKIKADMTKVSFKMC